MLLSAAGCSFASIENPRVGGSIPPLATIKIIRSRVERPLRDSDFNILAGQSWPDAEENEHTTRSRSFRPMFVLTRRGRCAHRSAGDSLERPDHCGPDRRAGEGNNRERPKHEGGAAVDVHRMN